MNYISDKNASFCFFHHTIQMCGLICNHIRKQNSALICTAFTNMTLGLCNKPVRRITIWYRATCIHANSHTPIPLDSTCRSIRETANTLTLACQCATHNIHKRPKAGRRHAKNVQRKIYSIQIYIQNIPKDTEVHNSSTCFHDDWYV